jgi:cysteinyl-tRNA synthetase
VEGQKMSKSLGNFYTLRDLIKRGYSPLAFRYLCLQTHYRSKMNFTWEALKAAENSLKEIHFFLQREKDKKLPKKNFVQYQQKIIAALEDDLDTPRALGLLHQANAFDLWLAFDAVLGLNLTAALADASYPEEVMELVRQREKLRKEGQFKEADKIREKIGHLGYLVEDTPQGTRLIKR